jgi:drug/metabolite transporter (DMT)-like permease
MAIAAFLFSVMAVLARKASEHASFMLVTFARAAVGALVALFVGLARRAPLRVHNPRLAWLRSILGTLAMTSTFFALSRADLPLSDGTTVFNLAPILVAVFAPRLLGERPSPRTIGALAIGFLGVLMVAQPALLFPHQGPRPATVSWAAALFAALTTALAMLALRRAGQREAPEAIALHFSVTATVVTFVLALRDFRVPDAKSVLYMLMAGLFAGLGQLALTRAYALGEAPRVAAVGYLQIAFAAVFGIWIWGEHPTALSIAGMMLVTMGGVVSAWSRRPAELRR